MVQCLPAWSPEESPEEKEENNQKQHARAAPDWGTEYGQWSLLANPLLARSGSLVTLTQGRRQAC